MGNKQSICKNINLTHNKFITNDILYIHHNTSNDYYISHNRILNLGSELNENFIMPYKLLPESIIEITNFEVKNSELKLLARITSKITDLDNIKEIWNNNEKQVNVISLFNISPNNYIDKCD